MINVNKELRKYIEEVILPLYDKNNIGGHDIEHINTVINRCFELIEAFNLDVNPDMIYVVAAYHDIGYKQNKDEHERVSSEMFLADTNMLRFFTPVEITIMGEAIVDHRASLEYEARSIYGKIVSSADREVSVDNMLKRSFMYQKDKHKDEMPTTLEIIEYSFKKLSSKYGKGGYAKMYFPDQKYLDYLEEMQALLEDKEAFIKREQAIAQELNNKVKVLS